MSDSASSGSPETGRLELKTAIEGLYRTFSRYPLPAHVEGCPHCVSDSDHALLYSKDLRDLEADELDRYTFKAMTTWGGADDFRHFLPRIFELISVAGEAWPIDPEIPFAKLAYGQWQTWPPDERKAITMFFEALWSDVLGHFPHALSARHCLCCIAQADDDMTRYLGRWHISQSLTQAKHLAEFVEYDPQWSPRHGWSLGWTYWEDRPVAAKQVVDWLRDPARRTELESILLERVLDEQDADLLSKAVDDMARLS